MGANGDGETDDTAALRKALAACDKVEGTSEASLAASVPRVSTDALPTQEPGPGPDRA